MARLRACFIQLRELPPAILGENMDMIRFLSHSYPPGQLVRF